MIIEIQCEICHELFDERDREPLGAIEGCPDCVKRVRAEDAAITEAMLEVICA